MLVFCGFPLSYPFLPAFVCLEFLNFKIFILDFFWPPPHKYKHNRLTHTHTHSYTHVTHLASLVLLLGLFLFVVLCHNLFSTGLNNAGIRTIDNTNESHFVFISYRFPSLSFTFSLVPPAPAPVAYSSPAIIFVVFFAFPFDVCILYLIRTHARTHSQPQTHTDTHIKLHVQRRIQCRIYCRCGSVAFVVNFCLLPHTQHTLPLAKLASAGKIRDRSKHVQTL